MKTIRCLIGMLLLYCCVASGQSGHRDPTPEDRNPSPDRLTTSQQADPVRIRKDADELAQLTGTLPAEVAQAVNGVLHKDLKDKLKRIEKLSKQLRRELSLE